MQFRTLTAVAVLSMSALSACGGGSSGDDFCQQIEDSEKYFNQFDTIDPTSIGDAEALAMFDDMKDHFGKLKDSAPDEIADDVELTVGFATAFADGLKSFASDTGGSPEENTEAFMTMLGEITEGIDQDELGQAGERISTYVEDECGIDADFLN